MLPLKYHILDLADVIHLEGSKQPIEVINFVDSPLKYGSSKSCGSKKCYLIVSIAALMVIGCIAGGIVLFKQRPLKHFQGTIIIHVSIFDIN